MYNRNAILNGIEKLKENIAVLEQAIEAEREKIKEYYRIIDELDKKERSASISVEIVKDDYS